VIVLTEAGLRAFLRDELGVETDGLSVDDPLFSSGLIDSFSLVTLLAHIERVCGFRIGPTDVNLDNFDSLGRMLTYAGSMSGQGR
jgi:acyl carrier protein